MRGLVLTGVVAGLLAIIGIALVSAWLVVNPNDYKPKIAAAVKDATGRDLVLDGDIKLSIFPWLALELGPASLGNPAGFAEQPFVSFTHASVRVKLLPLLTKRLEVGRVEVDGLNLKLLKNAAGKGNWEGFGRQQEPAPAASTPAPGETFAGIGAIKLTNARVTYGKFTLANLTLETGSFTVKGVVPITLHVDADRGVPGEHVNLEARVSFSGDPGAQLYSLAALNLNTVANLAGNERPVRFSVTAPTVDFDLKAQTMSAAAFQLNLAGALVDGRLQGTHLMDGLDLKGSVTLAPLVLREYLPRVGVTPPKTRDAKAWSLVSAGGDFAYGKGRLQVEKLQAAVDDTHLTGRFGVDLATQAVNFDLRVDGIDVDRYLAPQEPGSSPAAPRAAGGAEAKNAPGDAARPLEANGTLTVGRVHAAPLDLSNVKVTVATQNQVMHIFPLKATVDGGDYSGNITVDNRTATPVVSLDEHLSGIDVGQLLAGESKRLRVSGRGNVNLKATGRGGADEFLKTLNGRFDANVSNGAVEGLDLGFELGRAEALIRRQKLPNRPNAGRTQFDAFKLSADISNGVARTHDLVISSAVLKVTGQGSVNLPMKVLDFALVADTLRTAGTTALKVPMKVTGSVSDPTVRPDIEALAKGQLKDKLKDVLKDKLQGLFGKP